MKKVLSLCVALVVVMSLSLSVFAADGFVSSPSANRTPILVSYDSESDDCDGKVIVTPYADRDTLPADLLAMIEKAFDEVVAAAEDLTKLTADLAAVAADKNIAVENLAVSELFDVRYEGCTEHDDHGNFNIVIKADSLNKFVSLLHFNGEEWSVVENAKLVMVDGELCLAFTPESITPFAIVVNTDPAYNVTVEGEETTDTDVTTEPEETDKPSSPVTGDDSYIALYAAVMVVCVVSMAVVLTKVKKQSAK